MNIHIHVPADFEATMVSSGPASSLNPKAFGGPSSMEGGRREGKRECRDTAGLLVSSVTCTVRGHRTQGESCRGHIGRLHTCCIHREITYMLYIGRLHTCCTHREITYMYIVHVVHIGRLHTCCTCTPRNTLTMHFLSHICHI